MTLNADALVAYNFFARRAKSKQFDSVAELEAAVASGAHNKSCLPRFCYQPVLIDTLKPVSSVWTANYNLDFVKVKGGEVVEYYRRVAKPDRSHESYDLNTGDVLDHYRFEGGVFVKIGADGVRMVDNKVRYVPETDSFDPAMPERFDAALKNYEHRSSISTWTERGYGDVVYVGKYLEQV